VEIKKFYALFYHIKLTDAQVDKVLDNAVRKPESPQVKKGG
jgi:hypothetical protein